MLFILPMWVNTLIRTLATVALFDFLKLPLGEGALIFGLVYNFLPFMIYPIYNVLSKMDNSLVEAAQDLGANPFRVFMRVTQRDSDGFHAYGFHVRHRRTFNSEQYKIIGDFRTGKHQQRHVELRSRHFPVNVTVNRHQQPVYR